MRTRPATPPAPATRAAPRLGASALFVLSLVVAASVDPWRPMVRELQRETTHDRAVVRELAATVAKVVRQLVGSDTYRPMVGVAPARAWDRVTTVVSCPAVPELACAPHASPLRAELLALPPPALG